MYIEAVPNRDSPPAILLRESYREAGKVKKRTLLNLSDWPHERIIRFKALLKGGTVVPKDQDAVTIIRSLPHGHVEAALGTARKIGLDRRLGPDGNRCRDLILALVVSRVLDPSSKLAAARALSPDTATSSLGEQLGLGVVDEDELYDALDWLAVRQPAIEAALAKRHLRGGTPAKSSRATALRLEEPPGAKDHADGIAVSILSTDALDDRIAIVGTAGSGKTYAAKGFVERLLEAGARVTVVDPLGVWWGLRASADVATPGYPVIVFGGRHADVAITAEMGAALGRLIAGQALACVVDLSELGSSAARRRFMAVFAEALYEANEEPLHLVLDEADLWAPQRPIKGWESLLGHIEEIVRRGRVRGFIPWLITQRPAVVYKDVLSQADILIAMKLTASQDRDAIGAWIEGQADRQEGKRILGELPRLKQGEGYLWAPGHGVLQRVRFPAIRTFDSSRTPKRGERLIVPRALADVDLTAIVAALAAAETGATDKASDGPTQRTLSRDEAARRAQLEQELAPAKARIVMLEEENRALASRLAEIAALASASKEALPISAPASAPISETKPPHSPRVGANAKPSDGPRIEVRGGRHPAAQKLLTALAQHAPARFTWGQAATLAGLKPSGGHFNAGRKELRDAGYVAETDGLVTPTPEGLNAAGEVPAAPSTPAERLTLWCERLPAPAPEMLRTLAAQGERYMDAGELANALGKKPTGGHWNSGIAILRNNGLIETEPAVGTPGSKRYRAAKLFRN